VGFFLRNWHLKLSAVALATVLYTGLVFSGSFTDDTIDVPVDDINQPDSTQVLSSDLGTVAVTYRTSNDSSATVSAQAFVATVDLSQYDMDRAPEPQVLEVVVVTLTEGIEVLSTEPDTVRVAIDRTETRTVPVEVDPGDVPDGIDIDEPVVSEEEVQVRGTSSVVGLVDRAVARIRIDASGIDFNNPVQLVAVDASGQEVGAGLIDIQPETVSVQVDAEFTETNKTVPIRPDIEPGTPAPGFALTSLAVEPSVVTLRGLPEVLSAIDEVLTEPLSIDGLTSDQIFDAELVLGDDVRLAGSTSEATVSVTATIVPSVSSRTFVVGVVCAGAGDNACLPGIDQLTVTLSGPGGILSDLAAGDLTPTVDAAGLAPGAYDLEPSLAGLPDGVELLSITPGTVPVTIQAPATPAPTPSPAP